MKSLELRKKFFDYFVRHGHEKIASSSLIPAQDPTLLFTNAGMNQFKDLFLGNEHRSYKRAVSIQKCVRAGGKHNDLENVGFTQRHLTFFEMMGNFSFGDYFKKEAIVFAWEFLTKEIKFNPEHMYVSVHLTDDESFDIWHTVIGLPKNKIFRLGADNFWQMGDVGPCGPCTEIFVDRGSSYGCGNITCDLACGCDRFLEIWNNVFMQFNRQADGTDVPLKQTGVDTGMGLERLTMIVQNKESVFATDLFDAIFKKIEALTGYAYDTASEEIKVAFNVLGDHVRSSTFLIADGCAPSNDGRGYVLRKIIRRAALFAQKLTTQNIFPQVAEALIEDMKTMYSELETSKDLIVAVLESEIERFADNLVRGKRILQDYMQQHQNTKSIDGQQAFMLYDTYGFPLEVTKLIALEQNFSVDVLGFEKHMELQRQRSGQKMKDTTLQQTLFSDDLVTEFTGYQSLQETSEVIGLVVNDQVVQSVDQGQECWVAVKKSPFYVACGGQVNDQGWIIQKEQKTKLLDLKKSGNLILALIKTSSRLAVGDQVTEQVDEFSRLQTMKNHTATHLLQAALQKKFGKTVKQAGSLVTPDYLRFDYTYHKSLTAQEIKDIEDQVNQKIWENIPVQINNTTYKQAVAQGVIAFFGDKYNPESVRAIIVGDFSAELCGGTHVRATGDIGSFKITEEIALAAGQRRMVALTGARAVEQFQRDFSIVKKLCQDYKLKSEQIFNAMQATHDMVKLLQKEKSTLQEQLVAAQLHSIIQRIEMISDMPFLCLDACGYDSDQMRMVAQQLQQAKPGFYFLIHTTSKSSVFMVTIDKKFIDKISLSELKVWLVQKYQLQGGGNNLTLQGGGAVVDFATLARALKAWVQSKLSV